MTPRDALRTILAEMHEVRAHLVTRASWPAVRKLDDWKRIAEHAIGERSTTEVPAAEPDPA
jgi:hypothetical protein